MRCEEFLSALNEVIEANGAVSAELEGHGTACPAECCRNAWEDYTLLNRAITAWKGASLPRGFADRVVREALGGPMPPLPPRPESVSRLDSTPVAQVSSEANVASSVGPRLLSMLVPAIAAVCVALAVWVPAEGRRRDGRETAIDAPIRPSVGETVPPELLAGATMDDVHAVYADWMEGASSRLHRTATIVLLEEPSGSEPAPESGWLGSWSKRIEEYEAEIGETFLQFVESTKHDQS